MTDTHVQYARELCFQYIRGDFDWTIAFMLLAQAVAQEDLKMDSALAQELVDAVGVEIKRVGQREWYDTMEQHMKEHGVGAKAIAVFQVGGSQ